MSKIFEAIRKTEGDLARVAHQTLGAEGAHPAFRVATPGITQVLDVGETSEEGSIASESKIATRIRTEPIQLRPDSPILPFDGFSPRAAEQYKIIRTKILQYPIELRMLMLSSPMPGDGKTVTAINLAGALSLQEDANILLVDADFRRASLSRGMGWNGVKGLSNVLRGEVELEDALIRTQQFPNLYILPAGDGVANPAELMSSYRFQDLCTTCREQFRVVVFDAPPVGTVADYDVIQAEVDGVILIIRPDHTDRGLCRQAFATVPKEKQVGVIINCAEEWALWKTNSYYYYGNSDPK